ncbi:ABC-type Fe3+-hydroxamate transport system substrate-binding protein [Paenibacillus eucommiae]|uniref:ABC-type Fe3+-hydroxamate transport system substrate-binding protein n=1 Tax=Paenibacillus eucommiae TaxID=1355755 RepID=A0ABS4IWI0_9BACL|nr:ABC-type Fe3+-hydroxamate transport system substrate-binding protein [Paenibacillus eucommiae]
MKSAITGKSDKVVSLFRPRQDKIVIYLTNTFAGLIMKDAGVTRPEAQSGEGFSVDITEEQIGDLEGNVILWFNREKEAFAKLEGSQLWATLEGVKNNKVHPVDWEYWMSGLGIQAANSVLNDLNTFLAD